MKLKFLLLTLFFLVATQLKANNMLVKNVTTMGNNAANKTIQVQFDISWDNSWRDGINWDAAWVFMKYKDANGLWQHVQLNTTGFANGTGTANTIQVGSDKVGAFVYRSAAGTGTFYSTSMQLQWNYGLSGLTSVSGLEIRVFAVEMVYVPQGDFNIAKGFYVIPTSCCGNGRFNGTFNASGGNFPVINQRLTPTLTYALLDDNYWNPVALYSTNIRIKGDVGIDTNNDGVVDNTNYPTGYKAFYSYKYEMSEQQYADFLNTLTATQITTLGVAGSNITLTNGQYFTSSPNRACGNSNATRLFGYADWAGLRPMSILELNKATYGPYKPIPTYDAYYFASGTRVGQYNNSTGQPVINDVGYLANSSSSKQSAGASYYGIMDLTGVNTSEPVIKLNYYNFTNQNGNGVLGSTGSSDISNWNATDTLLFIDQVQDLFGSAFYGFRYVRSAE
jgi:hypothetical protein